MNKRSYTKEFNKIKGDFQKLGVNFYTLDNNIWRFKERMGKTYEWGIQYKI